MKLKVTRDGSLSAIYSDALANLLSLGQSDITRASHVEPCSGGWQADLTPVSGPVLGPFRLREQALTAEVEYLERNLFS